MGRDGEADHYGEAFYSRQRRENLNIDSDPAIEFEG